MKFLDLAVAAMIGASSLVGIISMAPGSTDAAANTVRVQIALRERLVAFARSYGLPTILSEPLHLLCQQLLASSNRTVSLDALIGSSSCGARHSALDPNAVLAIGEGSSEVVLEAWSVARG